MNVAVIGSGPASISCVSALIERGVKITIIDVGETLDSERKKLVESLASLPQEDWPKETLDIIKENPTVKDKTPQKLYFGSDFIHGRSRSYAPLVLEEGASSIPTFAQGGYSIAWGAAMLPIHDCDMQDWPFKRSELTPYFQKVLANMPLCGGEDPLLNEFPLFKEKIGKLNHGQQAQSFFRDLEQAQPFLLQKNTLFGWSRLAVHTKGTDTQCISCGLCLSGCPRGSIYSTIPTLQAYIQQGLVSYKAGLLVEKVKETSGGTEVSLLDVKTLKRFSENYDAIFIGAGVINTTKILLASQELFDKPVELKESQKFIVPFLRLRDSPMALDEKNVTLSSTFIETKIPQISDHWIHLQISPINEWVLQSLGIKTNFGLSRKILGPFLRRLMIAMGGLHSDDSAKILLTLKSGREKGHDALIAQGKILSKERRIVKRVAYSLFKLGFSFRSIFLYPLIRLYDVGASTHCGASFPMNTDSTGEFSSDIFGRPFGWSRIFAIDAAVLPSIPGTTLALTIMANAYRIGTTAPLNNLTK